MGGCEEMEPLEIIASVDQNLSVIATNYRAVQVVDEQATIEYCQKLTQIAQSVSDKTRDQYELYLLLLCKIMDQLRQIYGMLAPTMARLEMCQQLFVLCTKAILGIQWKQLPEDNPGKMGMRIVLGATHSMLVAAGYARIELLLNLMDTHWSDPVLCNIMSNNCDDEEEGKAYIVKEDPMVLKLRIELLLEEDCEEFVINLCYWCTFHPLLKDDIYVRQTQLLLLHKHNHVSRFREECAKISCHFGVQIVKSLEQHEQHRSVCVLLAQTFLIQDWINPNTYCCTQDLLKLWIRHQYLSDKDVEKFSDSIWSIAKLSRNTKQLGMLIDALKKECGLNNFLQLYTDLSIYALNLDKGLLDCAKSVGDEGTIATSENALARTCRQIHHLYQGLNFQVQQRSIMTAFALDPSTENFTDLVKIYEKKVNMDCKQHTENAQTTGEQKADNDSLSVESLKQALPSCGEHAQNKDTLPTSTSECKEQNAPAGSESQQGSTVVITNNTKMQMQFNMGSARILEKGNETSAGSINPATLYEMDRLFKLFRPWFLNPLLSWKDVFTVAKDYMNHNRSLSPEIEAKVKQTIKSIEDEHDKSCDTVKTDQGTVSRDQFLKEALKLQKAAFKRRGRGRPPLKKPETPETDNKEVQKSSNSLEKMYKTVYKCLICSSLYEDVHQLKEHVRSICRPEGADIQKDNENQSLVKQPVSCPLLKCRLCNCVKPTIQEFELHLATSHAAECDGTGGNIKICHLYRCKYCKIFCSRREDLQNHLNVCMIRVQRIEKGEIQSRSSGDSPSSITPSGSPSKEDNQMHVTVKSKLQTDLPCSSGDSRITSDGASVTKKKRGRKKKVDSSDGQSDKKGVHFHSTSDSELQQPLKKERKKSEVNKDQIDSASNSAQNEGRKLFPRKVKDEAKEKSATRELIEKLLKDDDLVGRPKSRVNHFCEICMNKYRNSRSLLQHYAMSHVRPYKFFTNKGKNAFMCFYCRKFFETFLKYVNHIHVHEQRLLSAVKSFKAAHPGVYPVPMGRTLVDSDSDSSSSDDTVNLNTPVDASTDSSTELDITESRDDNFATESSMSSLFVSSPPADTESQLMQVGITKIERQAAFAMSESSSMEIDTESEIPWHPIPADKSRTNSIENQSANSANQNSDPLAAAVFENIPEDDNLSSTEKTCSEYEPSSCLSSSASEISTEADSLTSDTVSDELVKMESVDEEFMQFKTAPSALQDVPKMKMNMKPETTGSIQEMTPLASDWNSSLNSFVTSEKTVISDTDGTDSKCHEEASNDPIFSVQVVPDLQETVEQEYSCHQEASVTEQSEKSLRMEPSSSDNPTKQHSFADEFASKVSLSNTAEIVKVQEVLSRSSEIDKDVVIPLPDCGHPKDLVLTESEQEFTILCPHCGQIVPVDPSTIPPESPPCASEAQTSSDWSKVLTKQLSITISAKDRALCSMASKQISFEIDGKTRKARSTSLDEESKVKVYPVQHQRQRRSSANVQDSSGKVALASFSAYLNQEIKEDTLKKSPRRINRCASYDSSSPVQVSRKISKINSSNESHGSVQSLYKTLKENRYYFSGGEQTGPTLKPSTREYPDSGVKTEVIIDTVDISGICALFATSESEGTEQLNSRIDDHRNSGAAKESSVDDTEQMSFTSCNKVNTEKLDETISLVNDSTQKPLLQIPVSPLEESCQVVHAAPTSNEYTNKSGSTVSNPGAASCEMKDFMPSPHPLKADSNNSKEKLKESEDIDKIINQQCLSSTSNIPLTKDDTRNPVKNPLTTTSVEILPGLTPSENSVLFMVSENTMVTSDSQTSTVKESEQEIRFEDVTTDIAKLDHTSSKAGLTALGKEDTRIKCVVNHLQGVDVQAKTESDEKMETESETKTDVADAAVANVTEQILEVDLTALPKNNVLSLEPSISTEASAPIDADNVSQSSSGTSGVFMESVDKSIKETDLLQYKKTDIVVEDKEEPNNSHKMETSENQDNMADNKKNVAVPIDDVKDNEPEGFKLSSDAATSQQPDYAGAEITIPTEHNCDGSLLTMTSQIQTILKENSSNCSEEQITVLTNSSESEVSIEMEGSNISHLHNSPVEEKTLVLANSITDINEKMAPIVNAAIQNTEIQIEVEQEQQFVSDHKGSDEALKTKSMETEKLIQQSILHHFESPEFAENVIEGISSQTSKLLDSEENTVDATECDSKNSVFVKKDNIVEENKVGKITDNDHLNITHDDTCTEQIEQDISAEPDAQEVENGKISLQSVETTVKDTKDGEVSSHVVSNDRQNTEEEVFLETYEGETSIPATLSVENFETEVLISNTTNITAQSQKSEKETSSKVGDEMEDLNIVQECPSASLSVTLEELAVENIVLPVDDPLNTKTAPSVQILVDRPENNPEQTPITNLPAEQEKEAKCSEEVEKIAEPKSVVNQHVPDLCSRPDEKIAEGSDEPEFFLEESGQEIVGPSMSDSFGKLKQEQKMETSYQADVVLEGFKSEPLPKQNSSALEKEGKQLELDSPLEEQIPVEQDPEVDTSHRAELSMLECKPVIERSSLSHTPIKLTKSDPSDNTNEIGEVETCSKSERPDEQDHSDNTNEIGEVETCSKSERPDEQDHSDNTNEIGDVETCSKSERPDEQDHSDNTNEIGDMETCSKSERPDEQDHSDNTNEIGEVETCSKSERPDEQDHSDNTNEIGEVETCSKSERPDEQDHSDNTNEIGEVETCSKSERPDEQDHSDNTNEIGEVETCSKSERPDEQDHSDNTNEIGEVETCSKSERPDEQDHSDNTNEIGEVETCSKSERPDEHHKSLPDTSQNAQMLQELTGTDTQIPPKPELSYQLSGESTEAPSKDDLPVTVTGDVSTDTNVSRVDQLERKDSLEDEAVKKLKLDKSCQNDTPIELQNPITEMSTNLEMSVDLLEPKSETSSNRNLPSNLHETEGVIVTVTDMPKKENSQEARFRKAEADSLLQKEPGFVKVASLADTEPENERNGEQASRIDNHSGENVTENIGYPLPSLSPTSQIKEGQEEISAEIPPAGNTTDNVEGHPNSPTDLVEENSQDAQALPLSLEHSEQSQFETSKNQRESSSSKQTSVKTEISNIDETTSSTSSKLEASTPIHRTQEAVTVQSIEQPAVVKRKRGRPRKDKNATQSVSTTPSEPVSHPSNCKIPAESPSVSSARPQRKRTRTCVDNDDYIYQFPIKRPKQRANKTSVKCKNEEVVKTCDDVVKNVNRPVTRLRSSGLRNLPKNSPPRDNKDRKKITKRNESLKISKCTPSDRVKGKKDTDNKLTLSTRQMKKQSIEKQHIKSPLKEGDSSLKKVLRSGKRRLDYPAKLNHTKSASKSVRKRCEKVIPVESSFVEPTNTDKEKEMPDSSVSVDLQKSGTEPFSEEQSVPLSTDSCSGEQKLQIKDLKLEKAAKCSSSMPDVSSGADDSDFKQCQGGENMTDVESNKDKKVDQEHQPSIKISNSSEIPIQLEVPCKSQPTRDNPQTDNSTTAEVNDKKNEMSKYEKPRTLFPKKNEMSNYEKPRTLFPKKNEMSNYEKPRTLFPKKNEMSNYEKPRTLFPKPPALNVDFKPPTSGNASFGIEQKTDTGNIYRVQRCAGTQTSGIIAKSRTTHVNAVCDKSKIVTHETSSEIDPERKANFVRMGRTMSLKSRLLPKSSKPFTWDMDDNGDHIGSSESRESKKQCTSQPEEPMLLTLRKSLRSKNFEPIHREKNFEVLKRVGNHKGVRDGTNRGQTACNSSNAESDGSLVKSKEITPFEVVNKTASRRAQNSKKLSWDVHAEDLKAKPSSSSETLSVSSDSKSLLMRAPKRHVESGTITDIQGKCPKFETINSEGNTFAPKGSFPRNCQWSSSTRNHQRLNTPIKRTNIIVTFPGGSNSVITASPKTPQTVINNHIAQQISNSNLDQSLVPVPKHKEKSLFGTSKITGDDCANSDSGSSNGDSSHPGRKWTTQRNGKSGKQGFPYSFTKAKTH